ncbi:hypothetical protein [Flagellimonas sp. 2504JD4-2]
MLLKKLIFSSILLCAAFCCSEDDPDCSLVDCLTVDNSIYIEFIDNENGANVITNGTYQASQISILDANTNAVDFELQKDFENQDLLVIDLQNESIGEQTYQIRLGDIPLFNFSLTTFDGGGSDCCGPYTGVDDASLTGITGEFSNSGVLPIAVTVFIP